MFLEVPVTENWSLFSNFCTFLSRWNYLFLCTVFQGSVWYWLFRVLFLSHFPAFVQPIVVLSGCNCIGSLKSKTQIISVNLHAKHIIPYGIYIVEILFTKFNFFQFFSTELHSLFRMFSVQLNFDFFFWTSTSFCTFYCLVI